MMFEIDDVASVGSVRDVPGHQLPPEVWTLALNMRYSDDSMASVDGWDQVFGTPIIPPHFALPVATEAVTFWLYVSLTEAAVFDGNTHENATRTVNPAGGLQYNAGDTLNWNGTLFGDIAILNNRNDIPQAWMPTPGQGLSLATNLQNLPNWPVSMRTRVIRAFGPFLIAFATLESGVSHPHRVVWSHPAAPGSVPPSWDTADTTRDTGEVDLPDVAAGVIVDALPLGNIMYVYKEASIWKMRYVGGQNIFDFGQSSWITTAGLLGPRCVCVTGDGTKHVLATQDDIIWHNGSNVQSILNRRQRRRLQNELDPDHFSQSFIFPNPFNNEVWFCYPASGFAYPNRALILNYKAAGGNDFVVTEADGITFRNTAVGTIESFDPEIWGSSGDVVTFTLGMPGVVNTAASNYPVGTPVQFATTGVLPTPLVAGTTYYVLFTSIASAVIGATPGGAALNFGGSPSGQHFMSAGPPSVFTDTWNDDTGPWSQLERRRVVLLNPDASKFYKMDSGSTRDGLAFSRTLQRTGLALIGKKRNGDLIVDHQQLKMFKRIWPKISGGPVDVRFGSQQLVSGMIAWSTPIAFNPLVQVYIDPGPTSGRAVGFEITSQNAWRLDGYKMDVEPLGEF